jgi:hypothetical protein
MKCPKCKREVLMLVGRECAGCFEADGKLVADLRAQLATATAERDDLRKSKVRFDAMAELLAEDVAFASPAADGSVCFNVLCSDTFAWACADGEGLTIEAAPEVLDIHRREGAAGVDRWVQAQRGGPKKSPFIKPVVELHSQMDTLRAECDALRRDLARLAPLAECAEWIADHGLDASGAARLAEVVAEYRRGR